MIVHWFILKDDEEDEDEANEEEGGLSKSGKELKKLLGRASGANDSDAEEDDDDEDVSFQIDCSVEKYQGPSSMAFFHSRRCIIAVMAIKF